VNNGPTLSDDPSGKLPNNLTTFGSIELMSVDQLKKAITDVQENIKKLQADLSFLASKLPYLVERQKTRSDPGKDPKHPLWTFDPAAARSFQRDIDNIVIQMKTDTTELQRQFNLIPQIQYRLNDLLAKQKRAAADAAYWKATDDFIAERRMAINKQLQDNANLLQQGLNAMTAQLVAEQMATQKKLNALNAKIQADFINMQIKNPKISGALAPAPPKVIPFPSFPRLK
jgi:hypothetical protein